MPVALKYCTEVADGYYARDEGSVRCWIWIGQSCHITCLHDPMGSVASSIGFVSELDFMIAMNLVACATGLAIAWLAGKGKLAGKSLSQVPAVIIFVAGLSLNFYLGPIRTAPGLLGKTAWCIMRVFNNNSLRMLA